ncbi:hypothetical protein [Ammoniphilus resinae]|uniref:Uncharacterized protein n=1 Tax=Ammoniphilus resinae TaxID=861532 RepID=A0ABS4GND7_9BACL|nr:hypothetical protein [Ammoniphilus resinae]MBP1931785.1 hypothetical protein [Ammoniphilus resinae]
MIHRDLCDPNYTKNYSPLRMQFHFVLSRFVCVNGLVPLTKEELAQEMKCDIQTIYKFIDAAEKENIIRLECNQIYLLKHVPSNDFKEGYVRHYPFLESKKFRDLSVQTQRFILYALWRGVYNPGMKMEMAISSLYHKSANERDGRLNLYSKKPALDVLEEAKAFLKFETAKNGLEWFKVTGLNEEFDVDPLHNQGEMKWLDNHLVTATCDLLSDVTKGKIIELKKRYFDNLGSIGLELVQSALDKVLLSFKLYQLETKNEVIPYLRAVLKDLEEKILPTIQKTIINTKQALRTTKDLLISGVQTLVDRFSNQLEQLEKVRDCLILTLKREEKSQEEKQQKITEPFPFYNWLEDDDNIHSPNQQQDPSLEGISNEESYRRLLSSYSFS